MPFLLKTLQTIRKLLQGNEYSQAHAIAQKLGYKKDSVENAVDITENLVEELHQHAAILMTSIQPQTLTTVVIEGVSLGNDIDAMVASRQNEAYIAMNEAASLLEVQSKINIINEINASVIDAIEPSLTSLIHDTNRNGIDSIPMIFAVFSRKNDYYGLGNMGA
jgi:tetrahydromethanopterin S-methyltransferase subunit B